MSLGGGKTISSRRAVTCDSRNGTQRVDQDCPGWFARASGKWWRRAIKEDIDAV